jgi:hypothetical protein
MLYFLLHPWVVGWVIGILRFFSFSKNGVVRKTCATKFHAARASSSAKRHAGAMHKGVKIPRPNGQRYEKVLSGQNNFIVFQSNAFHVYPVALLRSHVYPLSPICPVLPPCANIVPNERLVDKKIEA